MHAKQTAHSRIIPVILTKTYILLKYLLLEINVGLKLVNHIFIWVVTVKGL